MLHLQQPMPDLKTNEQVDFNDKKLYNGHQRWVPSLPTKNITTYVLFAKFQQIIFDDVWLTSRHIANLIDIKSGVVYTVLRNVWQ